MVRPRKVNKLTEYNVIKLSKGIRARGNNYMWDATVSGKRMTGTCNSVEEAVIEREKIIAFSKDKANKSVYTLKNAYEACYKQLWVETPNEINIVIYYDKFIAKYFGENCAVKTINTVMIDGFINWLKDQDNANSTINRKLSVLSSILKFCADRDIITKIPKIKKLKEPCIIERFINYEEENNIVESMHKHGHDYQADCVIFLVDTGLRVHEMLSLKKRDVNLNQNKFGVITIRGQNCKTKNSRNVPLTERANKIVTVLLREVKGLDELVFSGCTYRGLSYSFSLISSDLGYKEKGKERFSIHTLRHTYGSRLAQNDVPIQVIAKLMGHTNIKTTMRYAHLSTDFFSYIPDLLAMSKEKNTQKDVA